MSGPTKAQLMERIEELEARETPETSDALRTEIAVLLQIIKEKGVTSQLDARDAVSNVAAAME